MELSGRRAIVTGANRGLGRSIAESFVKAGASVLITARDESLLEQARGELAGLARAGQQVQALSGDVSDPEHCAAAVALMREMPGDATVLVNNAGILGPTGAIEEIDWTQWVEAVRINLFGTVLMCRAIIPMFRKRGYGKIINLSGGGATSPMPRFSPYAASKAAVVRLTETMAEELKEVHVDVNAIAPGAVNTRILDEVLEAGPEKVGKAFYEKSLKQREEGGAPPEKGAALSVFLASAASDGISGRLISAVWDDWINLPKRREQLEKSDVYTLRRIVPKERGLQW